MSRLPDPVPQLQGKDLELYHSLSAKRGRIDGMYRTLLNHPSLTEHVSDLGTYLRFESELPGNIREFAILRTAHVLNIEYEWKKHLDPACKAGVPEEIIDAIQKNTSLPEPYDTVSKVIEFPLNLKNIPLEVQNEVIRLFDVKGLLELAVLVGFYRMIAGIITAFDVPLPQESR